MFILSGEESAQLNPDAIVRVVDVPAAVTKFPAPRVKVTVPEPVFTATTSKLLPSVAGLVNADAVAEDEVKLTVPPRSVATIVSVVPETDRPPIPARHQFGAVATPLLGVTQRL
jgi:hypothetical protein